jgi:hypothetical protein
MEYQIQQETDVRVDGIKVKPVGEGLDFLQPGMVYHVMAVLEGRLRSGYAVIPSNNGTDGYWAEIVTFEDHGVELFVFVEHEIELR